MAPKKDLSSNYHPVELSLSCNTTLTDFKHHCLPGLNLMTKKHNNISSTEEISKLYNEPPIRAQKPLPCLVHEQFALTGNEDLVLKPVREKYFWKRRKKQILDQIQRKYKKKDSLKMDSIKMRRNDKVRQLPYIVTRLADHLSKNPDKNFKGLYNWYFDNALTTIQLAEQQYLLHAGGEQLNDLYISSIGLDTTSLSIPVVTPKFNIPLERSCPIFHIFSSRRNDRIGIRQRNSCTFFIFEKDCDVNNIAKKSFLIKCGNDPFVGADIGKQTICTVDTNRLMKLWDVSKKSCISETSLPMSDSFLSDKFVRVEFSRNYNSITAIDRKNIYSFDTRSNLAIPAAQWSCENYVEMCENISSIISSAKDDNYYIGANHSCLLLDSRFGFIQKWSHMLPQTPTVGHAASVDLESEGSMEILILCSQGCDDIVAVCNNPSSESLVTCSPFSLPNRIDTLHEARSRGVLYESVLQDKFDYSVIGLTSCEFSNHPTLFSLISTGDIFQQKLELKTSARSNHLSKKQLSYLENWENNSIKMFSNRKKPCRVVTHTVRMQDLFSKLEQVEVPEWKTKPVNLRNIQKFTKKELESYTDLLAPNLLNDYGVLNDSDWEDDEDNVTNLSSKSIDKVQNWLYTGDHVLSEDGDENDLAQNPGSSDNATEIDNTSILSFELSEDEL